MKIYRQLLKLSWREIVRQKNTKANT